MLDHMINFVSAIQKREQKELQTITDDRVACITVGWINACMKILEELEALKENVNEKV